jgi:hypothetical protein
MNLCWWRTPTYPHPRQERHLQRVLHHGSQPLLLQLLVRTGARVCSIGGWFGVCLANKKPFSWRLTGLQFSNESGSDPTCNTIWICVGIYRWLIDVSRQIYWLFVCHVQVPPLSGDLLEIFRWGSRRHFRLLLQDWMDGHAMYVQYIYIYTYTHTYIHAQGHDSTRYRSKDKGREIRAEFEWRAKRPANRMYNKRTHG